MNIAIVVNALLPATLYGGTERVAYSLGKELAMAGHGVTFLAKAGSHCPFGRLVPFDPGQPVAAQLPQDIDIVHFNNTPDLRGLAVPYVVTVHGNGTVPGQADPNAIFVSRDHATRAGASAWVHNGLDWDAYPATDLSRRRDRLHFLGKAAWRVKNVRGAMAVARRAGLPLDVLGGYRFNFKMGLRFTFDPRIHFHGMVDNAAKKHHIEQSRGLVFPVRWHEPFGLSIVESLYYGSPVFATPYGAIPEIVCPAGNSFGFLSTDAGELAEAIACSGDISPRKCHQYAADTFNSATMARKYLRYYEEVLNGHPLNPPSAPSPTNEPVNPRDLPWTQ